jgi:hypothetical protein
MVPSQQNQPVITPGGSGEGYILIFLLGFCTFAPAKVVQIVRRPFCTEPRSVQNIINRVTGYIFKHSVIEHLICVIDVGVNSFYINWKL